VHRSIAATAALALAALLPAFARADCTWPLLVNDVPVTNGAATSTLSFTAPAGSWGAVGVRSAAGSDHDLTVFQNTAGSPTCVANPLAGSSGSIGAEFVVGDFRTLRNGAGTWYPGITRTAGAGTPPSSGTLGGAEIVVDNPATVHNTDSGARRLPGLPRGGSELLRRLPARTRRRCEVADLPQPGRRSVQAGHQARLLESTGPTTFPAITSDEYCVVVVNDDGGSSTYSLAIDQCQPPVDLVSGTAVAAVAPLRYRLDQGELYWSTIGVRGSAGDDWNVITYKTGSGALEPTCFKDSTTASSLPGGGVDFVTGDFTYNPLVPYFARVVRATGSSPGMVEWDDGPDEILVTATPLVRGPVLGVPPTWGSSGGANCDLSSIKVGERTLVFERGADGVVRTGRCSGAVSPARRTRATPGRHRTRHWWSTTMARRAPQDRRLRHSSARSPRGPGPRVARCAGANPAFARTAIACATRRPRRSTSRRPGRVTPCAGRAGVGAGRARWDGRTESGRAAPGVYFVRMTFDGRKAGLSKLVLLP
jgi:hypothetical protein